MHTLPIMLTLWAVAVTGFTGLMVYRALLTEHETDQLFLAEDETVDFNHAEHDAIVDKVDHLRPLCQGFAGAVVLTTVAAAAIYIYQALPYIRFQF